MMSFKSGVVHAVVLLVVLSLVAVSSISIVAQQKKFDRELSLVGTSQTSRLVQPPASVSGPCFPIGDVDGDGAVKSDDAVAIVNYLKGVDQPTLLMDRADINLDGILTEVDAQFIEKYVSGIIGMFPSCPIP